ncbi:hypothetical protein NI17_017225 [Thermobifida halotolerans]|uniref:Uncharacterized protein n=1 Tax=Thermobifida halotolerans TaxID=483545 RepID=A0A399G194_9ACTN|nr:hypothetical protein [Thermobifida halotolerans]UOE18547.1 hypothetical protein NI17_017225 [Thermobifida halotolerans]
MVAAAARPLSVEFAPSGRLGPGGDEHDSAFQPLAADSGVSVPATSASPPDIVQVRGGKPGGGRRGDKGNDNGTERGPENNGSNRRPDDDRRGQRGNKYELELEDGQGQGQQDQQQGRSASGGFRLAWENPLNLVHELVDLFTHDKTPRRPAYGMTVGHRKTRSARR